jgi:hypothetical protein
MNTCRLKPLQSFVCRRLFHHRGASVIKSDKLKSSSSMCKDIFKFTTQQYHHSYCYTPVNRMQFMTHKLLNLFFYSNAMEDKLPTYDASTNLFSISNVKNTLYYVLFNFLNLSRLRTLFYNSFNLFFSDFTIRGRLSLEYLIKLCTIGQQPNKRQIQTPFS